MSVCVVNALIRCRSLMNWRPEYSLRQTYNCLQCLPALQLRIDLQENDKFDRMQACITASGRLDQSSAL